MQVLLALDWVIIAQLRSNDAASLGLGRLLRTPHPLDSLPDPALSQEHTNSSSLRGPRQDVINTKTILWVPKASLELPPM